MTTRRKSSAAPLPWAFYPQAADRNSRWRLRDRIDFRVFRAFIIVGLAAAASDGAVLLMTQWDPTAADPPRAPSFSKTTVQPSLVEVGVRAIAGPPGDLHATQTAWPTYLGSIERTDANLAERQISPADVQNLTLRWSTNSSLLPESSLVFGSGQVYFGSDQGNEYDVNASTGSVVWETSLGGIGTCGYGVYSTPTLWNGTLYTGGANRYWYALNASSGAVEWKVQIASNSTNSYNWASALVWRGSLYIGVASCMDDPLIQGKLLEVNLSGNHSILHEFDAEPNGSIGDSIWASPAGDPRESLVWVATGNGDNSYSDALVALNASTLTPVGRWAIPNNLEGDSDFGATPILVNDSTGRPLIVDTNKDGTVFALDRSNASLNGSWNPVWQKATGGVLADAAFDGGRLFLEGANSVGGSPDILAVDPANGTTLWSQTTSFPSIFYGGPVYAGGVLVDYQTGVFELRNASTGQLLRTIHMGGRLVNSAIVADGQLILSDGYQLEDFGFPLNVSLTVNATPPEVSAPVRGTVVCSGGAPPYFAEWVFGGGPAVSGLNATHVFGVAGYYVISAVVRDNLGSVVEINRTLRIWPSISVTLSPAPSMGELPNWEEKFQSHVSGGVGPPYTYSWTIDNASSGATQSWFLHIFSAPGRYAVQVWAYDSLGGLGTAMDVIQVNPTLSISMTETASGGDAPLTVGFVAQVENGVPPYSVTWGFSDGSAPSGGFATTHTFQGPGAFLVTVTATDMLGVGASTSVYVVVAAPMEAAVSVSQPGGPCPTYPIPYTFTTTVEGGTAPYTFDWSFNSGGIFGGNSTVTESVGGPGNYTIQALVRSAANDSYLAIAEFVAPANCTPPSIQPPTESTGVHGVPSWLLWSAGTGVAIAVGVGALFWIRTRSRRGSRPPPRTVPPSRPGK
ncbi:MAG TPA: PKD domain-containing protein [Thermoplasmata archaeon]|nr:PKD domain-containing protein [Thermoplasmata archaeon]